MGTWVRIGAALAISGRPMSAHAIHNPVEAIADSLVDAAASPEDASKRELCHGRVMTRSLILPAGRD